MKRRCPQCGGAAVKEANKFWPMCSERCQLVDLGKWLGEEYRIAGEPDPQLAAAAPRADEDDRER